MAQESIIPRRAERGLGYAPSITPAPLVQASQLMAPPAPAAPAPPESNELFEIAKSLRYLNNNLDQFGVAYLQNEEKVAKEEGEAEANADPEKARQVLRMGYQNAVKAGVLKESSNPTYWRTYMETTAKNIVEPGFQSYLYEKYLPRMSDPRNNEPLEAVQKEAWEAYLKDSGFNLDSVFAKAAANSTANKVFRSFSASALNKRLEAREVDARNQMGITIQRGLKESESLPSEKADAFIVDSFIRSVGEANASGMANPTYHALQAGVAPYIDQLRRVNPDRAMAILQTLKQIKLPNGYVVGEGNTLPLFNEMEENVIRSFERDVSGGKTDRGLVLTAAQDKLYEIMDRYPNLNDPAAEGAIINELLKSDVLRMGAEGKKEAVPLSGYEHLHGTIRDTARKLIQERRGAIAQPNAAHMNSFNLAVVNNDIAEAKRLYDVGQESGFNGTQQAKMLEAIQSIESYEPLLKSRSSQEARAIIVSTLGNQFKDNSPVSQSVIGLVDLEFNKAVKEEMDTYLQANPGQTQEQAAPVVMNNVRQKVLDRLTEFGKREEKAIEVQEARQQAVEAKNAELKNKAQATAGPSWFTNDELTRVSRERTVVRNFIELGRASKQGLAPADAEAVDKKLRYIDSKIGGLVDRLANEVNRRFETKYILPQGETSMAETYEAPKSAEKTEADLARYYSAKAVKGYSPAEIIAGETDHKIPIDPNLNPLLTPVFSSVEELASFKIAYRNGNPTAQKLVESLQIRDVEQFTTSQALAIEALGRGRRK